MRNVDEIAPATAPILLFDIDDTVTTDGRLTNEAFESMWALYEKKVPLIPVTGRPAGWCEMIARQWPVHGVIGENGAFYFRLTENRMKRRYLAEKSPEQEKAMNTIREKILAEVPGSAVASDQFCRMFDLAIDFCEDVPPLPQEQIKKIHQIFLDHGATAKISSIHVNGWFGDFNKLTCAKTYLEEELQLADQEIQQRCLFVGDSPNDEPMFQFFQQSVGVANVAPFSAQLNSPPKFITTRERGAGFQELCQVLLKTL